MMTADDQQNDDNNKQQEVDNNLSSIEANQSSLVASIVRPKRSTPSAATLRWKILSTAVHQSKTSDHNLDTDLKPPLGSVRRFESFGLIALKTSCGDDVNDSDINASLVTTIDGHNCQSSPSKKSKPTLDGKWFECRLRLNDHSYDKTSFDIKILTERIPIGQLMVNNSSADNTGNVCLWPSEEVLAYYMYKNGHQFSQKRVLELGGGMTCLAGLVTAIYSQAVEVIVTDGNERCVTNAQTIVTHNKHRLQCLVTCRQLEWGRPDHYQDLYHSIDLIICSDCLYFTQSHQQFIDTINSLLKTDGQALILAPKRGPTFDEFVQMARQSFSVVNVVEDYDQLVTDLHHQLIQQKPDPNCHYYSPDLHQPFMVHLSNKSSLL